MEEAIANLINTLNFVAVAGCGLTIVLTIGPFVFAFLVDWLDTRKMEKARRKGRFP